MRRNFLLLITSTILIISFGISTMVSLQSLNKLIKENNHENSVIYANEVSNAVIDVFSEAVAVSQSMNNTFIQSLLKNQEKIPEAQKNKVIQNFLSDIVVKFGYSTAFLTDASQMAYHAENGFVKIVDPSNPDDDWYEPFRDSGKLYELNIDNDQANDNRITVYINTRMEDSAGNFIGICGVGVPINQILSLLRSMEEQSDISIKLVNLNGDVQIANGAQLKLQRSQEEIKAAIKDYDFSKSYAYAAKGMDGFCIIKYIPECQWFSVIEYQGGKNSILSTMLFKNLMICLVILLLVLIVFSFVLGNFTRRTEKVVEESLIDELTGLKNRRAYQAEIEKLNQDGNMADISVATMDINGLKLTNDSFGHTAGDELIQAAANIMKEVFCENGWKVFRTGGDEFVALICSPVSDLDVLIADFKEQEKLFIHDKITELSVSIGTVQGYNQRGIACVEDLIKIADKRMYTDKETFYSQATHERRKR